MYFELIFFRSFEILGQTSVMESVPDLQSSMYVTLDGYPCVRLLNLSGEIGCSSKFFFCLYFVIIVHLLGFYM